MAKYPGVLIRSKQYLDNKDVALVRAFLDEKSNRIPVYYQVHQTKKANDLSDSTKIGYATGFRLTKGMMLCDVTIYPNEPLGEHFQEYINNYTVQITQEENKLKFKLVGLIVYDKDFIQKRMNEMKELAEKGGLTDEQLSKFK